MTSKQTAPSDENGSEFPFPFSERLSELLTRWHMSPGMWPVGYLISSFYSPLRLEQEIPARDWRDSFEDLLALESGGEMLDSVNRKEETVAARKIEWQRASYAIGKLAVNNQKNSVHYADIQKLRQIAKDRKEYDLVSHADEHLARMRGDAERAVAFAQSLKAETEVRKEWSGSRLKARGHWTSSLITNGALTGWRSVMRDGSDGPSWEFLPEKLAPGDESGVFTTETELDQFFDENIPYSTDHPDPLLYRVDPNRIRMREDDGNDLMPSVPPTYYSFWPERRSFKLQFTFAERITLSTGRLGTKVTMQNLFSSDPIEEVKVFVQEPIKVLYEVQKARDSINDRKHGFDEID